MIRLTVNKGSPAFYRTTTRTIYFDPTSETAHLDLAHELAHAQRKDTIPPVRNGGLLAALRFRGELGAWKHVRSHGWAYQHDYACRCLATYTLPGFTPMPHEVSRLLEED